MNLDTLMFTAFLASGLICFVIAIVVLDLKRRVAPQACALELAAFAYRPSR